MATTPDIFDVGPTPPSWTLPDTRPGLDTLDDTGASILSWIRDTGDAWIACEDRIDEGGEWVRSTAAIHFCEEPRDGLDAAGARRLAAALLDAADLLE